jgi:hypothetical protein
MEKEDWKTRFCESFIGEVERDGNAIRFYGGIDPADGAEILEFISKERKKVVEDILRLIDKIEVENQDDSFDEWREYKHIRNSIVDKFLTNKNENKS